MTLYPKPSQVLANLIGGQRKRITIGDQQVTLVCTTVGERYALVGKGKRKHRIDPWAHDAGGLATFDARLLTALVGNGKAMRS